MKQFSIEFRKIESKVLTITSQKKGDIRMRTLQASCLKCRKTQETLLELVFSFSFRKEWRVFLNQSQSKMKRGRSSSGSLSVLYWYLLSGILKKAYEKTNILQP